MSCLCHGLCICLCHCLSNCLFDSQVMSPHHSDHIYQRSQVSRIPRWMCFLNVFVFVFVFVYVFVFFWSDHVSSSLWSYFSKVTSLWYRSLNVFSNCICLCHCLCRCICLCLCICLCHSLFVGQVMTPHHSEHMSQRSQVSRIALWLCSLNVFDFVIVIVFVFVFVIVFLLVRSCLIITLNIYLKGHKSLGSLFNVKK